MMIYKSKRSQAILDFVLVFGILLVFLVGLVRIWVWFNANYAKRNVDYQNSRLAAGTADDTTAGTYTDNTFALNDRWVFEGKSSGTVGVLPKALEIPDGPDGGNPDSACSNARKTAANMRSEANSLNLQAISIGGMYCPSKHGASCRAKRSEAQRSLRAQAASLMAEADKIEAKGCNAS